MLNPDPDAVINWPDLQPLLAVIVDTEAEFDWAFNHSRKSTGVRSVKEQHRAHRVFERFGVRPTYVLDYPVSTTPEGYHPIRELLKDGDCEIGAHLQPWDTPPFTEHLCDANSYPGNLPVELERAKLHELTAAIEANLGVRPVIYKAGRYGVGKATPELLVDLGYLVDVSVLPHTDLSAQYGPDFCRCGAKPYWCGPGRSLLEIPMSVGFTGALATFGVALHRRTNEPSLRGLHIPGVLARLRLFDRVTLSPEGVTVAEQRRLTKALLATGHRIFSLTYHSPSLEPGNTPYVRSEVDLRKFLDRIEQYLEFFMGEVGGVAATPLEIRERALTRRAAKLYHIGLA
jgi:hypothetical protein